MSPDCSRIFEMLKDYKRLVEERTRSHMLMSSGGKRVDWTEMNEIESKERKRLEVLKGAILAAVMAAGVRG
tara:strand:+ start:272 stop:484 length:213 start_codon:yes stop_codon:yes gene_type:complete